MAWPTIETWIPARLRQDREDRGLSRTELGLQLGISASAIKQWERGTKSPGPLAYDEVRRFFGRDRWFYAPVDPERRTLTDWRLRSGVRLADMRSELHLHHGTVYAIEDGTADLADDDIARWCALLDFSPEQWHRAHSAVQEVQMSA